MGIRSLTAVQPLHVATWVEQQTRERSAPTAKQRLAALRHLFDWLVTGQVIPTHLAASVRRPRHSATTTSPSSPGQQQPDPQRPRTCDQCRSLPNGVSPKCGYRDGLLAGH